VHVGYATGLVCLEPPHHLPALADNVDDAIARAQEQAIGACADAGDVAALEELRGVFVGEGDLSDFKEVERLPLRREVSGEYEVGEQEALRKPARTEIAMLSHWW
jgi:hypothetical protein